MGGLIPMAAAFDCVCASFPALGHAQLLFPQRHSQVARLSLLRGVSVVIRPDAVQQVVE